MALYEDLIPEIRADVHGAPDFTIQTNLQAVGADFFTRTGVWSQRLDDVRLQSGVASYSLYADGCANIIRVQQVWRDSVELRQQQQRDILRRDIEGLPSQYSVMGSEITVAPIPGDNEEGSVLRVLAVLSPRHDAEQVPDHLFSLWRDALVYGTKARMLESPTQPWANMSASAHFRDLYNRELRRAKVNATTSNGAPLKVQHYRF